MPRNLGLNLLAACLEKNGRAQISAAVHSRHGDQICAPRDRTGELAGGLMRGQDFRIPVALDAGLQHPQPNRFRSHGLPENSNFSQSVNFEVSARFCRRLIVEPGRSWD